MPGPHILKDVCQILGSHVNEIPKGLRRDKYPDLSKDTWVECKQETLQNLCGPLPFSSDLQKYALSLHPPGALTFHARLESRLIINHAGGIPENTGLELHPVFGIPFIPGTALRGVARSVGVEELAMGKKHKDRTLKELLLLFGFVKDDLTKPESDLVRAYYWPEDVPPRIALPVPSLFAKALSFRGLLSFLPATPLESLSIVKDIATCHHSEYYRNAKDKAWDTEDPNPQIFPALEPSHLMDKGEGALFRFILAPLGWQRGKALAEKVIDQHWAPLEKGKQWLVQGLENQGIGAKTSSGYGWFSYDPDYDAKLIERENQKKAALEKERQERLQAKRDADRRATLSKEERFMEDLYQKSPEALAEFAKALKEKEDYQVQVFLQFLLKDGKDLWNKYAKAEEKARKKGKNSKDSERAKVIREMAEKWEVTLP